jgi:hypothetical protein
MATVKVCPSAVTAAILRAAAPERDDAAGQYL